MAALVDLLSWILLVAGAVFYAIGAIGLNRMPDVFTRMHAVSVSDTLGFGLLTLGMILQAGPTLVAVKLVIIVLVVWTTGAVASHALARAALHDGLKPLLTGADGRLKPTDCVDLFPELGVRLATPLSSETIDEATAVRPPLPGPDADDPVRRTAGAGMAMAGTVDGSAGSGDGYGEASAGANRDAAAPESGKRGS